MSVGVGGGGMMNATTIPSAAEVSDGRYSITITVLRGHLPELRLESMMMALHYTTFFSAASLPTRANCH